MFGILSENFAKRYEMMPEQLQESFDGAETAEVISQVAAINNLSSEQLDVVTCLTGDVLAGFINYNDFPKKLVDEFGFDAILAQDIFKEIDRQVFLPVRDLLKQVFKLEIEGVEPKIKGKDMKTTFDLRQRVVTSMAENLYLDGGVEAVIKLNQLDASPGAKAGHYDFKNTVKEMKIDEEMKKKINDAAHKRKKTDKILKDIAENIEKSDEKGSDEKKEEKTENIVTGKQIGRAHV